MRKIRNKNNGYITIKNISAAFVVCIGLLFLMSFFNTALLGRIFLHEAVPYFRSYNFGEFEVNIGFEVDKDVVVANDVVVDYIDSYGIIGLANVVFDEVHAEYEDVQTVLDTLILQPFELEELRNSYILRNRMYTVDPRTVFLPEMFDVYTFMSKDMRVNMHNMASSEPVVLIFHTHSTEFFVDSYTSNKFSGIVGVGAYLAGLLNNMGISTLHLTDRFDFIDGQSHIMGAYERQEPRIREVLAQHPTIEIIIDMHRDGLPDGAPKLITYIDGNPTAQIMFFNGLSLLNQGGIPIPIAHLPNPYLPYNLAFSFQMQMAANQLFPGLTRRIYLNAFRYSLHFLPKSLLVEVGAQNNYFHEAINAMYPLAKTLASIIK